MSAPLSHITSLAISMHAQPGVYAILLGSGVSSAARIPTGWGIVKDLVRKVATTHFVDDSNELQAAGKAPDTWWEEKFQTPLGYSALLEYAGITPGARQGILANYFEPDENDEEARQPTKAHRVIAELVKHGYVRVIITTNFDRLMEQALAEAGVSVQIITRPEAVNGMAPLAHSPATLVKLHGDYKDLETLNTPNELSVYPKRWRRLLAQIFDEYGLVIAGWSADWDQALVKAIESTPSRRYPMFWDSRSSRGDNAQRLLKLRAGVKIEAQNADDLFGDLQSSVEALERLSHIPISTDLLVARLKRYLLDPTKRIDLHDLVMKSADEVLDFILRGMDTPLTDSSPIALEIEYEECFMQVDKLAQLVRTGIWHDSEGAHDQLWIDVLQQLVDAGIKAFPNGELIEFAGARRIPAFLILAVASISAIARGREELVIRLATNVDALSGPSRDKRLSAAQLLHYLALADDTWVQSLPQWKSKILTFPQSHLFKKAIWRYFETTFSDFSEFERAFHGFEYRLGILQERSGAYPYRAIAGEYLGEYRWNSDGSPMAESDFRHEANGNTVWSDYLEGPRKANLFLLNHSDWIGTYREPRRRR